MLSEEQTACAHLRIERQQLDLESKPGVVIREWWECRDCNTEFVPIRALTARNKELEAEVREWLCDACNTVYPGPPKPGLHCVVCPKCGGMTGPRLAIEKRRLEASLAEERAEQCRKDALESLMEAQTLRSQMEQARVYIGSLKRELEAASVDTVPNDLMEAVLKMGRIEWGATAEQLDGTHLNDFANTLRITRESFPLGEKTKINGAYLEGTETVLCHTGNSPNSANNARVIVGLWNQLHDTLKMRIDAARKEPQA